MVVPPEFLMVSCHLTGVSSYTFAVIVVVSFTPMLTVGENGFGDAARSCITGAVTSLSLYLTVLELALMFPEASVAIAYNVFQPAGASDDDITLKSPL